MARISEQSIEKVRQASDIVEVVSSYVELKQRGRNFFGLCPFHNEKTPSFSVNPDKQIYKCFGCGSGGSSINFIMEIESLEFPDAIKKLADSFNIVLQISGGDSKKYTDLKSQLLEIHTVASHYYEKNLLLNENKDALNYLTERGLSIELIKKFKLGFSSDSFDDLLKVLREKNYSAEAMKLSGLFIQSDKGYFNRFRSRIMFPIQNQKGDVIAFGGRIFNKDDPAKYQNSPETPIYLKSHVLYGINHNIQSIREKKEIILVEGYMDLLQLSEAGINNCLAISGTAFTDGHATILKRFTKNIFITFDGDDAGKKAAIKCGYILTSNELIPKIITPPNELDPDDWIRQDGKNSFQKELKNAQTLIKTHYNYFSSINKEGALNINDFIQECLEDLIPINDPIILELMIKEISELTSIDQNNIMHVFNEKLEKRTKYKNPENKNENQNTTLINTNNFSVKIYDDLIRLCFSNEKNIRELIFENLNKDWILSPIHKNIYESVYIHLKSPDYPPISVISEQIKDKETRQKLIDLTFDIEKLDPKVEMGIDCLVRIEQIILKQQISKLREKLRQTNDENILTQLASIEKNINNIAQKYNEQ